MLLLNFFYINEQGNQHKMQKSDPLQKNGCTLFVLSCLLYVRQKISNSINNLSVILSYLFSLLTTKATQNA